MPNDRIRAVSTSGDLVLVLAQMAYFRSVDRGRTFQKLPLPFPNPLSIATGSDKLVSVSYTHLTLPTSDLV